MSNTFSSYATTPQLPASIVRNDLIENSEDISKYLVTVYPTDPEYREVTEQNTSAPTFSKHYYLRIRTEKTGENTSKYFFTVYLTKPEHREGTEQNTSAPTFSKHYYLRIRDITNLLNRLGYSQCAKRIEFLQDCNDFEEGEEPLSSESAKSFLFFIQDPMFHNKFCKLGEPLLGLSSKGILGATWKIADDKHLWVRFHKNHTVSFAMIGPNPNSQECDKFRLNGHSTRSEVIKILRNQGVAKWKAT